jgi:organic radical activating enzyme
MTTDLRKPVQAGRGLLVTERFGPTYQGEGPSTGHPAVFVRLSRCNLTCGKGGGLFACDTPYTWDWERFDPRVVARWEPVAAVAEWALDQGTDLVVITGGEPLLQQGELTGLVSALVQAGRRVEFETNGTIAPAAGLLRPGVRFNVSPKLASSGMPAERRIVPAALEALAASGAAVFKFVVCSPADLVEVDELVDRFGLAPVWIMPEGTDSDVLLEGMRALAEEVIGRRWHLGTRLHIHLWGDEPGR